jgi:hypothetical protein
MRDAFRKFARVAADALGSHRVTIRRWPLMRNAKRPRPLTVVVGVVLKVLRPRYDHEETPLLDNPCAQAFVLNCRR